MLTYTASNPVAFKVEMGNIGQHYFQWRYGGTIRQGGNLPTPAPKPAVNLGGIPPALPRRANGSNRLGPGERSHPARRAFPTCAKTSVDTKSAPCVLFYPMHIRTMVRG